MTFLPQKMLLCSVALKQNVNASKEGLYKTMTNLLGFNRTGDAIVSRYDKALNLLTRSGIITVKDDMISNNSCSAIMH